MSDDIQTCTADYAEAQAYLRELLEERDDVTPEQITAARREVARCRYAYYAALVDDGLGGLNDDL
jgi:DNA-binding phage protein